MISIHWIKTVLNVFKWLGYFLGAAIFLAFVGLHLYKTYLKHTTRIEASNGISSLEQVQLGKHKQWIFIRSKDQNNPVLLFLHGGPGEPALGMASSRILDSELIKHYTVVHWDQLGAGKSYSKHIPAESMTMERWVEDCDELIDYLIDKFDTRKVLLVGHSAGTILGLRYATKHPGKLYAYISISQIVNNYEQQRISYNSIVEEATRSGDLKSLHAIQSIGAPPYATPQKEFLKARYIVRNGGFIHQNIMKGMGFIVMSYLTSPEYSFVDGIRTLSGKGLNLTMRERYEDIRTINFSEEVKLLKTPVYFLQGKYDMINPTVLIEEFCQNLNAEKGKRFIVFEHSAHAPLAEEKSKYQDLLINEVLGECMQ